MWSQLVREETLVPPNLRTTNGRTPPAVTAEDIEKAPGREWKLEFVVFEIAELPFQTALGEDVLEFAPGRTAFLYPSFGLGSPIDAIDDAIVVVILFGSAVKEFLVEVEVVVVSLAHHLIPVR